MTRPVMFLSAGIPDRPDRPDQNAPLFAERQPDRIQRAVTHLARVTLASGWCLLFGGHPAISPLVLEVLRRFVSSADRSDPRVIIYQSERYRRFIPPAAIALSDDPSLPSRLRWTPDHGTDADSLLDMRTQMLATPGIAGAAFVGGLFGVVEEADLFHAVHPTLPMLPLRSTASAAAEVARRYQGRLGIAGFDERLLGLEAYPLVAQEILTFLEARRSGGAPQAS